MIAVILAGGKGTRLRPFSISLPKPLMPVGNFPILEILIRQLKKAGVTRVIIAVGYLDSLIRAYFGNGEKYGMEITYSSEDTPMGTAGPLNLLRDQLNETFLFLNGDILTDINYAQFFDYHKSQKSVATVAASKRKVEIDFGVVRLDQDGQFKKWDEKPVFAYLVSMGIYALEPKVLELLPNGYFNMPDLIVTLHRANERVAVFIHPGYWLDIGRPSDYQIACESVVNGDVKID